MHQVAIMGSGPAGWAVANALAKSGVDAVVVSPTLDVDWPQNFGCWLDELDELGLSECSAHVWARARVKLDAGTTHVMERPYARIDGKALRDRLGAGGGERVAQAVVGLEHNAQGSTLQLDNGRAVVATVVIDATGAQSPWTQRPDRGPIAAQTAYGLVLDGPHEFPLEEVLFMDFRATEGNDAAPPTFLYAQPLGPDRVFVEETALVARPPLSFEVLRGRLERRLGRAVPRTGAIERCFIPMGIGLPFPGQPLIPFGAAAAMVHPATGYQVMQALRCAPQVAAVLAAGFAERQPRPDLLRSAQDVVWPASRRQCWSQFRIGMEIIADLDTASTRRFFDAFFRIDPDARRNFLRGDLSPLQLQTTMARVFARARIGTRLDLVTGYLKHALRNARRET